jgi:16S rRNA (guanine(527)-N(7))-methyltransferase RsmG
MTFQDALVRTCSWIQLSPVQLAQLERHYDLLYKWNRNLNLTSISSFFEVVQLHYCESLFIGSVLPRGDLRIVDVGSGAGFPGIPLAIARPECEVTLVEAHQRKGVFLREAARGLENISVIVGRAEKIAGGFDWLVGRGVRPSDLLSLNVASHSAIFMTAEELLRLPKPFQIVPVPGTRNRVIAQFHVERDKIH